jgi:glutamyl-tRNA reductase
MELLCLGLSHQSAPVEVRERLALPEDRQLRWLGELSALGAEAFVLSTCNRVEFYVASPIPNLVDVRERLHALVAELAGPLALPQLYEHQADRALVHLFRVAASLDSMVLGEAQILGQVKDAFERAQQAGTVKGELTRACAAAFSSAKRVRTETEIGRSATSMASAAVSLATKVFGGLEEKKVLLVGAGEMAELAARHLKAAGVQELWVTNRTLARAEALAEAVGGRAHPFESLSSLLIAADVILCSTASPTPIFTREKVAAAAKPRKHRPLFMVDLAVPRDIAADVNELDGVYAYDVDDIQKVISENTAARATHAAKAEAIIAEEIARFVRSRSLREGVPVLAQLRSRAESIARIELERTLVTLGPALTDKQRKSLEAMALAIVNKLLHQPTAKLRAVGGVDHNNALIGAAAELFGLEASVPTAAENDPVGAADEPGAEREAADVLPAGGTKP